MHTSKRRKDSNNRIRTQPEASYTNMKEYVEIESVRKAAEVYVRNNEIRIGIRLDNYHIVTFAKEGPSFISWVNGCDIVILNGFRESFAVSRKE